MWSKSILFITGQAYQPVQHRPDQWERQYYTVFVLRQSERRGTFLHWKVAVARLSSVLYQIRFAHEVARDMDEVRIICLKWNKYPIVQQIFVVTPAQP